MSVFGWILVILFSWLAVNKSTDTTGRVVCLALVLGTLFWGTGTGL